MANKKENAVEQPLPYGAKEDFIEFEVRINEHRVELEGGVVTCYQDEKLKMVRPRVRITPEQADLLNRSYFASAVLNKFTTMLYKEGEEIFFHIGEIPNNHKEHKKYKSALVLNNR